MLHGAIFCKEKVVGKIGLIDFDWSMVLVVLTIEILDDWRTFRKHL